MTGIIGTGLGGILLALGKRPKGDTLGFLLGLSSGVMLAVVFQDLIPEALMLKGLGITFAGVILGVISLLAITPFLPQGTTSLTRTSLLLGIGIALHNLPEGLAIGAGYLASPNLGLSLALALCLHDIPEGMAMAAPLLAAGFAKDEVVLWTILAGLPMGLGALIGGVLGTLSPETLAGSLSFAAGAMLFLVFHELLPQALDGTSPLITTMGAIIGVLIGLSFLGFC
ncbi:MAG: ZIP family metal transporter [Firmicutes bacterium]|nr:ZIP family metal transporter [Bacillota bacterium]